jgi:serine O-acetyltransferase
MTPERLWRISAWLRRRGLRGAARLVKKINSLIYHNSLAVDVQFSPDIRFGHHGFGTMIHSNVVLGERVKIWHNVTLAVRAPTGAPHKIVVEDDVTIGANAVVVAPRDGSVRIGKGARIGAGAVVTKDVPPGATVVSAPVRVLVRGDESARRELAAEDADAQIQGGLVDELGAAGDAFDALDGGS